MLIKTITDTNLWNDFLQSQNPNTFLQSLEWQNFNNDFGHKTFLLGLFGEGNQLISIALVSKVKAKRAAFLVISHGPIFLSEITTNLAKLETCLLEWKKYLYHLAKQEKCDFVRIAPLLDLNEDIAKIFARVGFRKSPIHIHAEHSSLLDLTPSLSEILLKMRKTTRQMIKKAEKMVASSEVVVDNPSEITEEIYSVYTETTKRGNFVPYNNEYLKNEWKNFSRNQKAQLVVIKHKQKVLSWGMLLISQQRAFYHQGGNLLSKDVPASYLCQWQCIQFAKEKGCLTYDFWGVSPDNQPNHPWANISLFKRGFGGQDTALLPAQDLVITPKYWFNWLIEKYRSWKRGFGGE